MPRRRASGHRVLVLHSSYGGPSKAVADALAAELRRRPGLSVELVDFFETAVPSMGVLARFAYPQTGEFFFGLTGRLAEADDSRALVQELRLRGVAATTRLLVELEPAAIISTCPIAAGAVAEALGSAGPPLALMVTDFSARHLWVHPRVDRYFVPVRETREDLVVHGAPYDRSAVTGIPVHERVAEHPAPEACRAELGLSERFTVAIAGAGALAGELGGAGVALARSATQVIALTAEDPRVRDRVGRAFAGLQAGQAVSVAELRGYGTAMGAADLVVCAPGSPRIAEALAAGNALILYAPVPAREVDNADFLVNWGAALLARDEADIVEKCRFLAGHPQRHTQMVEAATELGRGSATRLVCDRLLADV